MMGEESSYDKPEMTINGLLKSEDSSMFKPERTLYGETHRLSQELIFDDRDVNQQKKPLTLKKPRSLSKDMP